MSPNFGGIRTQEQVTAPRALTASELARERLVHLRSLCERAERLASRLGWVEGPVAANMLPNDAPPDPLLVSLDRLQDELGRMSRALDWLEERL